MGVPGRWALAGVASLAILAAGTAAVQAAAPPVITSYEVGTDAATGRARVTLNGTLLTKIHGYTLSDSDNLPVTDPVTTLFRSKSQLVLLLPAGVGNREYDLTPLLKAGQLPPVVLRVADGLSLGGHLGSGTIPSTGTGDRMMWYPGKAAFRAGSTDAATWSDANIGIQSFAGGAYCTASGAGSTAAGGGSTASGDLSTAFGSGCVASGFGTVALGSQATASGDRAVCMGDNCVASGDGAAALGESTTASCKDCVVLGRMNVVAGDPTNYSYGDPALVVGNGSSGGGPSNAFTLLKNGNLTIAGTLTEASDARLKTDVAPLRGVLPRLAALRAVTYRWRDGVPGPTGTQVGFLAQEVRAAFPELVQEDARGTLSVAYGKFSAVLLEAMKEQQEEIAARDAAIASLRRELETQRAETERRLARLEERLAR